MTFGMLGGRKLARGGVIALAVALAPSASFATPGLSEHYVSDPSSGIALYGYDPVAYFTEGRPVPGRRDIEAEWGGAAWRFSSEANRAAFLSSPQTYAPRFGGYDPSAVAVGVAAAGHPLLFVVSGERLYLFRTEADRRSFDGDRRAEANWPRIAAELAN